ncbi:MAG: hypothetical protein ACUVV6_03705 [Thermoplasmatota archaeon]
MATTGDGGASETPAWKAFLAWLFLLSVVLGPVMGMVAHFSPLALWTGWYVGTSLLIGLAAGVGVSALLSAILAARARG